MTEDLLSICRFHKDVGTYLGLILFIWHIIGEHTRLEDGLILVSKAIRVYSYTLSIYGAAACVAIPRYSTLGMYLRFPRLEQQGFSRSALLLATQAP
jgi:hypothetical protein